VVEGELNGELIGLESNLEQVAELEADAKTKSAEWNEAHLTRLEDNQAELVKLRKTHADAKSRQDEHDLAYDGAMMELKPLQKQIKELTNAVDKDRIAHDRLIFSLESDQNKYISLLNEQQTMKKSGRCPTCGQTIKTAASIEKHTMEVRKELARLKKIVDAGMPNDSALMEVHKKIGRLEAAEKSFQVTADEARHQLDLVLPLVAQLSARITEIENNVREREEEENPYKLQLKKLRRERNTLTADIREAKSDLVKTTRRIERTKYWVKGFKDVKLYIIDELLAELQMTTNMLLEEVGLVGWAVDYAVDKETKAGTTRRGLSVTILSPGNKKSVRWESWSGGEGQRLRIVGALSLSEVLLNHAGLGTDLEILDEPTRHLSSEGVKELIEFLADRAAQIGKQTWYVDHQAVESVNFTTTTTVTKTKAGSVLDA